MPRYFYAKPGDLLHVPAATIWSRLSPYVSTFDPRACWVWSGGLSGPPGYRRGLIQIDGVADTAPRWAWRAAHPKDPRPVRLAQLCSTETCLNPLHHSVTHARFQKIPQHALPSIFAAYATGETQQTIANRLGVSQQQVSYLLKRYGPQK